jgi:hypothetical protein
MIITTLLCITSVILIKEQSFKIDDKYRLVIKDSGIFYQKWSKCKLKRQFPVTPIVIYIEFQCKSKKEVIISIGFISSIEAIVTIALKTAEQASQISDFLDYYEEYVNEKKGKVDIKGRYKGYKNELGAVEVKKLLHLNLGMCNKAEKDAIAAILVGKASGDLTVDKNT